MRLMCIDKGSYHLTKGKIYSGEICTDCPSERKLLKDNVDYF